jgi:uncharacterized protein
MTITGFDNITLKKSVPVSYDMPSESFSKSEIAEITANENEAFNNRTFFGTAKDNLTNKTKDKLKFQFALSSRGYVTFALFLLGLLVGRSGFFEKVSIRRKKISFY